MMPTYTEPYRSIQYIRQLHSLLNIIRYVILCYYSISGKSDQSLRVTTLQGTDKEGQELVPRAGGNWQEGPAS